MPELGTYGSVRGALSNERPYRDPARALGGRSPAGLSHLNICELEQDLEEEGVVPACLLELSTHGAF